MIFPTKASCPGNKFAPFQIKDGRVRRHIETKNKQGDSKAKWLDEDK
jgi:hypothetical protein